MSALKGPGLVTRQASFNAGHILIGTIAGAVNTILVLPKAFAEQDSKWGLILTLTSWAMILAQLLNFGGYNTLLRFLPQHAESEQKQRALIGFSVSMSLLGTLLFGAMLLTGGAVFISWFKPDDAALLDGRLLLLFVLFMANSANITLGGFLSARLKTTWITFVQETFLKTSYLVIACLYLLDHISFEVLLRLYVGTYLTSTLLLLITALRNRLSMSFNFGLLERMKLFWYGLYSVLDRGIAVIVHRTDLVMMGIILSFSDVAAYNLAFYIGAVTLIPQKAISAIANPLVAKAIAEDDREEMRTLYRKSALNQLLVGGLIFAAIWAAIDEIMWLLPERFSNGKWVVLYIGLSKLIYLISGTSGALIQYSRFYRANFVLNLGFFAMTVLTNYLCMSPAFLDLGMEGAAIATACSFAIYNGVKIWYVKSVHRLTPWSRSIVLSAIIVAGVAIALSNWHPVDPGDALWGIVLKSGLAAMAIAGLALSLGLSSDVNAMWKRLIRKP